MYHVRVQSLPLAEPTDRAPAAPPRWLLLIHQIPPKPSYLRVKIWRRLQRLGAVPIKNSVYVLPRSDQTQEDFEWVRGEITSGGGDASICEARFVDGLPDEEIEASFNAARDADYRAIAQKATRLDRRTLAPFSGETRRVEAEAELRRLRKRFDEVAALDFFAAAQGGPVDGVLNRIAARVRREEKDTGGVDDNATPLGELRARTWVTRRGLHVDRLASAWLIRRFIDPEATFKFVTAKGYVHAPGEIRFDMFDAEFTHEGDRCTFEVLLERLELGDPALLALAEIVHDIDLKDEKFMRPEVGGIESLINGIAMAHKDDAERLARGEAVFADLYAYFRRKTERDRREKR
jgi:hypothetical protein